MSKQKSKPIPRWMSEHTRKCKSAFGLHDWRITIARVPKLKRDGQTCAGFHTTVRRTLSSGIDYDAALRGDDFGYDVVTHEFLHVALIEPDIAFRRVLDFVPKKHKAHCQTLYTDAKEHTVEALARSITPVLRAVTNEGKKA